MTDLQQARALVESAAVRFASLGALLVGKPDDVRDALAALPPETVIDIATKATNLVTIAAEVIATGGDRSPGAVAHDGGPDR